MICHHVSFQADSFFVNYSNMKHKSKINVALIWPDGIDDRDCIPLSLAYLVSNADKEKYNIKIFDCVLKRMRSSSPVLEQEIVNFKPQIVGISSYSINFPIALEILKLVKSINPSTTTIMGGPHATCYPEKTLEHREVDFVFRGEGEIGFQQFLDQHFKEKPDWTNIPGLVFRNINGEYIDNGVAIIDCLDDVNIPEYDAIDLNGYFNKKMYRPVARMRRTAPIVATRGCPYKCAFCAAPLINGKRVRRHSINYLTEWVKYLYSVKNVRCISIIDDNFTFDIEFAKLFCEEIIDMQFKNLRFETPNGIRMEKGNSELWTLMKRAGWRSLTIAPESGSKKTLNRMKKGLNPDIVPEVVSDIRKAGLKVHGFFIVGYPGENKEDIYQTVRLIKKTKFNSVNLFNFQPLPGTAIYNELVQNGEISSDFLPQQYSLGRRTFTPVELKDFNFNKLIFKQQLLSALRNPIDTLDRYMPKLSRVFLKKLFQLFSGS